MGVEIPLKGAARGNEEKIVGHFVGVESLEHSHAGLTDYLAKGKVGGLLSQFRGL